MVVFLLLFIGFVIVATQCKRALFCVALLFGYVINVLLVLTQRYIRPIFYSSDQKRFLDVANELASLDFFSFLLSIDPTSSYVISWFSALIFKMLGTDALYVNFFFVYAWLGTIICLRKLSLSITGSRSFSLWLSVFMMLTPSVSIVNAALLRESFVIFFITCSFYYLYNWYTSKKTYYFVKSLVFVFFAGLFHGALYFFFVLFLLLFFKNSFSGFRVRYSNFLVLVVVLPLLFFASMELANNVKVRMAFSLISGDDSVIDNYLRVDSDFGGREGINRLKLPEINTENPIYFVFSVVERMVCFSFSPFIHQYYKITDIPRIYDSLLFVFTCILCFLILRRCSRSCDERLLFYCKVFVPLIFVLIFMFSIGSIDVGTSQRHRLKFMPVFVVVTFSMYYLVSTISSIRKSDKLLK